MATDPYGDDWHIRHLSHRRRHHPHHLRRYLRSYRPPDDDAAGTWRITHRRVPVRCRAERSMALRRSCHDGRWRRPDRRTFDGGNGGVQRRRTGEAGRIHHSFRPGFWFRRGPAAWWRAHAICAVAHSSQLLGPVHPYRLAVHRDLVPASPCRRPSGQPMASEGSFLASRIAHGLHACVDCGDNGLYARRADPVARRASRT